MTLVETWEPDLDFDPKAWQDRTFDLPPRPPKDHFPNEMLQEIEWRKCAADPLYFLSRHWWTVTPDKGMVPFRPFNFQSHSLDVFERRPRVLVLKGRQIGYTTVMEGYTAHKAMFFPDSLIIYLSRRERDALKVVRGILQGITMLPKWMRDRCHQVNKSKSAPEFSNGSVIRAEQSQAEPARGEAASLIVLDEWAFYPNPEAAWASIGAAADVGGDVIALSTANGDGTPFSEQWRKARKGESEWCPMFFGWWARPDRDAEWHRNKSKNEKPWVMAQEWPTSEEEAFRQAGMAAFNHDWLDDLPLRDGHRGALFGAAGEVLVLDDDNLDVIPAAVFHGYNRDRQGDERLTIWHHPSEDRYYRYVIGADCASGRGRDYSSAHVLGEDGQLVATWHDETDKIDPDEYGEVLYWLGRYYHTALIGVERNHVGIVTARRLVKLRYPNLYVQRTLDKYGEEVKSEIGWYTSKNSKPILVEDLAGALRDGIFGLCCEATSDELRAYRVLETGSEQYGGYPNDDRVISLGVANQMLPYASGAPTPESVAVAKAWTLAWWRRRRAASQLGAGGPVAAGSQSALHYAASRR